MYLCFVWWWRRGSVLAYGTEGPGFDSRSRLNFFRKRKKFGLHIEVSTFSSVTPTLDVGLFFSHLFLSYFLYLSFPVQFARDTIVFFLPSSSLLTTYASCTIETNVLCSVSVHYHCLCWDPAIRTKLVLLVYSGGSKKKKKKKKKKKVDVRCQWHQMVNQGLGPWGLLTTRVSESMNWVWLVLIGLIVTTTAIFTSVPWHSEWTCYSKLA